MGVRTSTSFKFDERRRTSFVEEDFNVFVRILEQGEQDGNFRNGIVSTTGVATNPTSGGGSGEENDHVSQKLDVEQQILPLFVRQLRVCRVERDSR